MSSGNRNYGSQENSNNQRRNIITTSTKATQRIPAFQKGEQIYEITGKRKKYFPIPESKEISKFSRITIKKFPNSNRVLLDDEKTSSESRKRQGNSSAKFNEESKQFSYISNVDYKIKRRPVSSFSRESYDFQNLNDPKNNIKTYISESTTRRGNKTTPFDNYSTTTQIANLPGGVKRKNDEIKDDSSFSQKRIKLSESYKAKIVNDYNTNISCLPGCPYNPKTVCTDDIRKRRVFNNRSQSDIFNLKPDKNTKNSKLLFNTSHKRIYPEKNNTTSLYTPKEIRRENYKNKSQISFC